ncbi:hypothetical protein [Streptomyces caatingaensis]|uniref:DUF7848 domain-containing protein n=1 Tax=Streptomyces caatingaensis TaxID=1678637 RepID=A0A0K9XA35_9ACTN|nr:hypothetical protein [Streptomyces caatingaensis]KNB50073.1 hypothetical protein AC230_25540 [Streptomyces caatingaensis]
MAMTVRRWYRHAEWTTMQDPNTAEVFSLECSEQGCGAEFSVKDGQSEVESWKYQHTISTGHRRFWETYGRSVLVGPPPGAIVAGEIVGHERAVDSSGSRGRPVLERVHGATG